MMNPLSIEHEIKVAAFAERLPRNASSRFNTTAQIFP